MKCAGAPTSPLRKEPFYGLLISVREVAGVCVERRGSGCGKKIEVVVTKMCSVYTMVLDA